jgi:protein tyrosine phosphatase (PTP) superfamily phosphohydrolase (DUF442 family)
MSPDSILFIRNVREVDASLLTSGQPSEDQLAAVARSGVEVVINLAPHDAPSALKDEAGCVAALSLDYVHIPVAFSAPTEKDLAAFFDAMDANRGRKTLVHCAANKRVTAFLGLYRIIRLGWVPDEAFALMRSVWEPDAVWSRFIEGVLQKHRG